MYDDISVFEMDITTVLDAVLKVQHLGEQFFRESNFNKLNDSLISAICLKAGSITQACRTADEQHFTLPTTALRWFYRTSFPWARSDPTF